MKKKYFFKFFLILLIFPLTFVFFSGCKNKKFKNLISYCFLNNVQNLDPQTACKPEETTIIKNIFEGLYVKDLNNNYQLGAAKNVEITDDETTYIFTLKDNMYWKTEEKNKNKKNVTAKDFVFAFKRLISPKTNSPFASNFFFIKNAEKINKGILPMEKLGVFENENSQLVIKLEKKTPNLKELLASCPAMPCNEEFFNSTNARYGTTKENIISNGPFFLNSWSVEKKTTRFKIRKNNNYYDKDKIKIIGVNFSVRSKDEAFNLFKNKEINTAILNYYDFNQLNKDQLKNIEFKNKVIGIIFNQQKELFENEKARLFIAYSINREKLKKILPENQTLANSLFLNEKSQFQALNYDPEKAKEFLSQIKQLYKKNKINLNLNQNFVLTDDKTNPVLNQLLQTWQKDLKIFLKIDEQKGENYFNKLKKGEFDIALASFSCNPISPNSAINSFLENSPFNYSKASIETSLYTNSKKLKNSNKKAEQIILEKAHFIPLTFETEYFVFNNKIKNILFNPTTKEFYYKFCQVK